jgi:predicted enzyme related to lactoylglutathione lyase
MEVLMKLAFVLTSVPDLEAALPFYRDTLGLDEAWRESTDTVAFQLPGTEVQMMLVAGDDPSGPMYQVDSVAGWLDGHPDVKVVAPRSEIPGGSLAALQDPAGNIFYVLDQTEE